MMFRSALPCVVAILVGAHGVANAAAGDSPNMAARPAKIVSVVAETANATVSFPGVLQAAEQADLTFPVSGRLVELPVNAGSPINAGDLIARIEEPRYDARLASAQAEFDKAFGDLRRAEELVRTGATTRRELDARRAALDVAEATLNAAREDVAATRLTAPFAGIIARRHVEAFQNVRANEPVVTLQDLRALDVLIHVPTRAVLGADGRRQAVVTIDGLPNRTLSATVRSFSPLPDPVTQTYAVLLRLEREEGVILLPGMAATVRPPNGPEGGGKAPITLAPVGAVASDAAGAPYVWLVDPTSGAVSRRTVTLGALRGDAVEIVSGLAAGDRIVGAGLSHLSDGMVVRPWTATP